MDHIRSLGSSGSRCFRLRLAALTCLMCFALGVSALAGSETSGRHVKVGPRPEYPELARKLNIRGTVRVQLLVAPDGHVKETKVLGGSPLLVQAVVDTVKKWKYEPASSETSELVRFDFGIEGSGK